MLINHPNTIIVKHVRHLSSVSVSLLETPMIFVLIDLLILTGSSGTGDVVVVRFGTDFESDDLRPRVNGVE